MSPSSDVAYYPFAGAARIHEFCRSFPVIDLARMTSEAAAGLCASIVPPLAAESGAAATAGASSTETFSASLGVDFGSNDEEYNAFKFFLSYCCEPWRAESEGE